MSKSAGVKRLEADAKKLNAALKAARTREREIAAALAAVNKRLASAKSKKADPAYDPMGTVAALKRGATLNREIEEIAGAYTRDIKSREGAKPVSIGVLEDHPRIDLRVILKGGTKLDPRKYEHWELSYDFEALRLVSLSIARHEDGASADLVYTKDGQVILQTVAMRISETRGRERAYFICPDRNVSVEVMAFRDGFFASPVAQKLRHRSQSGEVRAIRRRKKPHVKAAQKTTNKPPENAALQTTTNAPFFFLDWGKRKK